MGKRRGNDGSGTSMSVRQLEKRPNHHKPNGGKITTEVIIGGHKFEQTLTKPEQLSQVRAGIQTLIPSKK